MKIYCVVPRAPKTKKFCNIRWCISLQKFGFVALNFNFCSLQAFSKENSLKISKSVFRGLVNKTQNLTLK